MSLWTCSSVGGKFLAPFNIGLLILTVPNSFLPDYQENTEPGVLVGAGYDRRDSNEVRVESCWFPGYRNGIIGTRC